jgi:hypothetical protein
MRWDKVVAIRDENQCLWEHPYKEPCHTPTYIKEKIDIPNHHT